ncbi:retrovirus-related pol polyprotein from transposon TNT 1-94 [Tanacetum coccineum]
MLGKTPNKVYDPFLKAGLGYKNPERLKKAIAAQPKMYDGEKLHSTKLVIDSPDLEETLEDAKESQLKMRNKMVQINYAKLRLRFMKPLYLNKTFVVEQTYFSIPSTSTNSSVTKENLKELNEELVEEVQEMLNIFESMEQKVDRKSSKENILQNEIHRLLEVSLVSVESSNSVRRQKSKDTKSKNKVLKNTNAKSSAAHVRKMSRSVSIDSNKFETMNSTLCHANKRVLNTRNVIAVNDGSNIVCVSCGKDVFLLSHEKCVARYALSRNSSIKRALFTTLIATKSKNLEAISIVAKSRLSVAKTPTTTNKVIQLVLWIVDNGCSKHMTGNLQLLRNFIEKFIGTVRFENDHFAVITGYGDYVQGNLMICHGDDLLTGSRLSHLNFGTINQLASKDLVGGLSKFKYNKDHLCSACEQGKSKKASLTLKLVPSTKSKLELLYMDLCEPMRVASINGKKYILVIVDDYSRTDNGTKFKNEKLRAFYAKLGIVHQTLIARTPQQNGVVERQNRTLVEATRKMLIFSKAPEFIWTVAIATAYFTQNRTIVHTWYNKTPDELIRGRKPNIQYFHVFGSICYPTNDHDDLGKMKPKADISIFIGYSESSRGFHLDNLFGPMYEEYYATSSQEVLDNSTANTLDNKHTSSSLPIVVKEDEAPQRVSSSSEQVAFEPNSPVLNENTDEFVKEDVTYFDGNVFYNAPPTPVFEEAESSSTYQIHQMHSFHQNIAPTASEQRIIQLNK